MFLTVLPSLAGAIAPGTQHLAAVTGQSTGQIFCPRARDGVIRNPGIGYQTFYKSAATDQQLPSSTMYVRFYWSGIERAPAVFNFSLIDRALSQAQAAGRRLAFHIMAYDNGEAGPGGA